MDTSKQMGWTDRGINQPVYDLAVVIGRFQPVHYGHMLLFTEARQISHHQLILIGSSFIARNIKNPFTYQERREMILEAFNLDIGNTHIMPLVDDLYNDQRWVAEVQAAINMTLESVCKDPKSARVAVIGHYKDESSYYLNMFPSYESVKINQRIDVDGTHIREWLLGKDRSIRSGFQPNQVYNYLSTWRKKNPEVYDQLCGEYEFIKDYKSQFSGMKFPPTFITTDAVVICHGHILLVRRRAHPGKGLWALPGGFLNQDETIEEGIIRELLEETSMKGTTPLLLKASLKGTHVFDAPGRSLRGRTITHAGLIVLPNRELPKVKGTDDAEKAKWFPISEFYDMTDQLFEDHYSIGTYMISRAG